jgi:hypothetical protein
MMSVTSSALRDRQPESLAIDLPGAGSRRRSVPTSTALVRLPPHAPASEPVRTIYLLAGAGDRRDRAPLDIARLDAVTRLLRRYDGEGVATILVARGDSASLLDLIATVDAALPTVQRPALRSLIGLPGAGARRALEVALEPTCPFGTVEVWCDGAESEALRQVIARTPTQECLHHRPPRVFLSVDSAGQAGGSAVADELARRRMPYCLWRARPGAAFDERAAVGLRYAFRPSMLVA